LLRVLFIKWPAGGYRRGKEGEMSKEKKRTCGFTTFPAMAIIQWINGLLDAGHNVTWSEEEEEL